MPLTFKQYLMQNKKTTKQTKHSLLYPFVGYGYYLGFNHPHNDQAAGDISQSSLHMWSKDTGFDLPQGLENEEQTNIKPNQTDSENSFLQTTKNEDPNKQGTIRRVKGAHLVYKRKADDGTFQELWVYNIDNIKDGYEIRKAILAGTDIPLDSTSSEDGTQTYTMWTIGNAQLIKIEGLPN